MYEILNIEQNQMHQVGPVDGCLLNSACIWNNLDVVDGKDSWWLSSKHPQQSLRLEPLPDFHYFQS